MSTTSACTRVCIDCGREFVIQKIDQVKCLDCRRGRRVTLSDSTNPADTPTEPSEDHG